MASKTFAEGIGLSRAEAAQRLRRGGFNRIAQEKPTRWWRLWARQFGSPLVWLLIAAALLAGALGDRLDAAAIAVILFLNAGVGSIQESRAEKALFALRQMTAPRARVVRDAHTMEIPADELVVGDLLLLEAGDVVAADASLVEAHVLSANEAILTGESLPVPKHVAALADTQGAKKPDAVYMGTSIATGIGRAVVTATGMATSLGRIADLLAAAEKTETPLQKRLRSLSRTLVVLCLLVVGLVAAFGLARGAPGLDMFLAAVSLAVAAVPEGLPAVVTIALAVGVQRMASRNVLVRKLPAVETLGCATVICTDKTGTLTTGQMEVRELWAKDHTALLTAAVACCNAELGEEHGSDMGDATELAILRAAWDRSIRRRDIETRAPRLSVAPFDSERRRMSVLRADGHLYVKGAVEAILGVASTAEPGIREASEEMASRGLRVLGVATGNGPTEMGLHALGVIGFADPPRTEATQAVADAQGAGIRTVMITGDHPATARAIAREMGILRQEGDLTEVVHARATPEDKLNIVETWKKRGDVVAMTGDGVNDAPALRAAHIGIAMGRTGTAVSREAADMILTDDNFASIVAAIREGRGIFENIRKSLLYLLAGNTGELALMLGASVFGLPLPLEPLQILWINLVTDGLPALALVMDPTEPDILRRPPRSPKEPILGRPEWRLIIPIGLLLGATSLGLFAWVLLVRKASLLEARTLTFSSLVYAHVLMSLAFRSRSKVLWQLGPFTNLRLMAVVACSVLLQFALLWFNATRRLFQLSPPGAWALVTMFICGLLPISVIELAKLVPRRTN